MREFKTPMGEMPGNTDSKLAGRSISRIVQEMLNHLSEIIRAEFRLVQTELRQDATRMARAWIYLGAAAVMGFFTLGFFLLSAVYALSTIMPAWLAAILVGALTGIVATSLLVIGRNRLKVTSLKPEKTIQSLEDNITWLKTQAK